MTAALAEKEALVERIAREVVASAPGASLEIKIEESYRNMREVLDRHPDVVERARDAIRRAGLEPIERPIRGGTDGSRLSFMGLPTPNLFAGEHNFHSRLEWVSRAGHGEGGGGDRRARSGVGRASARDEVESNLKPPNFQVPELPKADNATPSSELAWLGWQLGAWSLELGI